MRARAHLGEAVLVPGAAAQARLLVGEGRAYGRREDGAIDHHILRADDAEDGNQEREARHGPAINRVIAEIGRDLLHRGKMRGASTSGVGRGEAVRTAFAMCAGVGAPAMFASICAPAAVADFAYQPALVGKDYGKSKMTYPDFQQTASGLLYKVGALPPCAPPSRQDYTIIKPPPRC